MTVLKVICGWCGKKISKKDGQGTEAESLSICNNCLNLYFPLHADIIRGLLEVKNIEEIYNRR